jgi:hypothetical protein
MLEIEMPNWCENTLVLKHADRAMLERVVDSFKNGPGLFAEFFPMPKELEDTDDWCCDNWGTKWDVRLDNYSQISDIEDNTVTLQFTTAWSPPEQWLAKMSNLAFVFKLAYEEGSLQFYGIFTNASGVRNSNYYVEDATLSDRKRNTRKREAFEKRFNKICLDKAAPDFALPISMSAIDWKTIVEQMKTFVEGLAITADNASQVIPKP